MMRSRHRIGFVAAAMLAALALFAAGCGDDGGEYLVHAPLRRSVEPLPSTHGS